jgi:hypothetical protein
MICRDFAIDVVVKYDEKLLLPLLIEASKLMISISVEEIENLQFQDNAKYLFHPISITIDIYRDLVSMELVGFYRYLVEVKNYKNTLS